MRIVLALAAMGLLAGCGGGSINAPSLAPRPEERSPIALPLDEPVEPAATLDPALAARIADVLADAEKGHRHFEDEVGAAEGAAARAAGQPQGSDAWVAAQAALSALGTARGPVSAAAAALGELQRDPANATPANRAAIADAVGRVGALEQQEAETFDRLSARIG